jgi:hypothetical protein
MSRKSRERWLEAEEWWPALQQFLSCYLHQDWPDDHGSPEKAIDAAICENPLDFRQAVAREWCDWNATRGGQYDPRAEINDGFGVEVAFENPDEARQFMNSVYDKLVVSIRREAGERWTP